MIKDEIDGVEMDNHRQRIAPGGTVEFEFATNARDAFKIRCSTVDEITVEARLDAGDAWQNIAETPLDLSAAAPDWITIYFRASVAADAPNGLYLPAITIRP